MTASVEHIDIAARPAAAAKERFGGTLRRGSRFASPLTLRVAGKRWNPVFAVVEHRGRKTGRAFATPVAARRVDGGFVISLAFGARADWFLNLMAARGGTIRWRGRAYRVTAPGPIDAAIGLAAFNLGQRVALRAAGIGGYVRVDDVDSPEG